MSNRTCVCCGNELGETARTCSVCGFFNTVTVMGDLDDGIKDEKVREYKKTKAYKEKVINNIFDIALEAYSYGYIGNEFKQKGTLFIKIASGKECFESDKPIWCNRLFGPISKDASERRLTFIYEFAGTEKKVEIDVSPDLCLSLWKPGIIIDSDLNLLVFVYESEGDAIQQVGESISLDLSNDQL